MINFADLLCVSCLKYEVQIISRQIICWSETAHFRLFDLGLHYPCEGVHARGASCPRTLSCLYACRRAEHKTEWVTINRRWFAHKYACRRAEHKTEWVTNNRRWFAHKYACRRAEHKTKWVIINTTHTYTHAHTNYCVNAKGSRCSEFTYTKMRADKPVICMQSNDAVFIAW